MLARIEETLPRHGLSITGAAHALTHDENRYFGLLEIRNGSNSPDFGWVLGLRNSHDKRFPAGMVVGSQVFVCDNLAFCGEIEVSRKHTRFVLRDLPMLIDEAVQQLAGRWTEQDRRIDAYKGCRLSDNQAHDLTVRALDAGVICASRIPNVLQEWRNPRHEEFKPRNTWSWFNAVTETVKGRLHDLPRRTQALHRLCDGAVGLN